MKLLYLFLLSFSVNTWATELPRGLSESEVKEGAKYFALSSLHRWWTAHATRNPGLGLDVGVDSSFVFRGQYHTKGEEDGVIPRIVPVPRFWFAWDFDKFYLSGSVNPGTYYDGIGGLGLGIQWNFYRDPDEAINVSAVMHYTYANIFGDMKSHTPGASVQISKDLVVWQPYAGLGFAVSNVRLQSVVLDEGLEEGPYSVFALHSYAGIRLDFLAKLAFQIDLINTRPSLSLVLSNSF